MDVVRLPYECPAREASAEGIDRWALASFFMTPPDNDAFLAALRTAGARVTA